MNPDQLTDPYVFSHEGVFYALGSAVAEAKSEYVIPLLRSSDGINWERAQDALKRPDPTLGDHFLTPEVAFEGGLFYLYYSVGHGQSRHQIRVATSARPEGPYQDTGKALLDPGAYPSASDPHPFRGDDGVWYLSYIRELSGVGPAFMIAKLENFTRLSDERRVMGPSQRTATLDPSL